MSEKVRTAIVEDEPPAREMLRDRLLGVEWVELVGEAADGPAALELVDRLEPRLLFLDVRLPELDGIEVLRRARRSPEVVFTTAWDAYALVAFELGALDYLVKPFGRQRLDAALERVRRRLGQGGPDPSAAERAGATLGPGLLRRLFARSGDRIVPIPVEEIRRIQARGDYAEVHTSGGTHLLHVSLAELEARLEPGRFRRVHRSHIVNLDSVRYMRAYDDRRLLVVLQDGEEILASRSASEQLRGLAR